MVILKASVSPHDTSGSVLFTLFCNLSLPSSCVLVYL